MCAILIFKNEKSQLPKNLSNMFIANSAIHNDNTRNKNKYHRWCVNTNFASYSCRHHAPEIWNLLPANITSISFHNSFKRNLKFLDCARLSLNVFIQLSSLSVSLFPLIFLLCYLLTFVSYHSRQL